MKEIIDTCVLQTIAGGDIRYVSKAEIMFETAWSTLIQSACMGGMSYAVINYLIPSVPAIAITAGIAGGLAGIYLGYSGNCLSNYCGKEPGYYNVIVHYVP